MATENKEVNVRIVAGPSLLELVTSLTRKYVGPYGIDMEKATSVHFTTDLKTDISAFSGSISTLTRSFPHGEQWIIEGFDFDFPHCRFEGTYNTKTRNGNLTVKFY